MSVIPITDHPVSQFLSPNQALWPISLSFLEVVYAYATIILSRGLNI